MPTKKTQQPRFTLHYLLSALSFWGTSARLLLMVFLAGAVLAARLGESTANYDTEVQAFIYIVGSFFVLDAGYVMIARALKLKMAWDVFALLVIDLAVALAYVVPNFIDLPGLAWLSSWTILVAIFVLSIRILMGLLLANQRKR